ncbi:MAG TPA: hypothetical protein VNT99_18165 [Methylomirabilota bacterium]|nr:hypothetical protein [Methylomirabilota bacterium]
MRACLATFTLLEAPIALAELARHLATRQDFILSPCRPGALSVLQLVTEPYGYDVEFHAEGDLACLRYRGSEQRCLCGNILAHLSSSQQIRLLRRSTSR